MKYIRKLSKFNVRYSRISVLFFMFAATNEYTRHSVGLHTTAPQQITCWHLGKTKYYPEMALREKLAWQRTC